MESIVNIGGCIRENFSRLGDTVIHIARQLSQIVPNRLLETSFPDTLFKLLAIQREGEITACTGQDIVNIINGNELKSAAVDVYLTILANTAFSNDRRVLVVQTHDFSLLRRDWARHRLYLKLYKKHAHVKYDYAIAVCNLRDIHWVLLFLSFQGPKVVLHGLT